MQGFVIEGGKRLSGEVSVCGAKNAALPILAACVLTRSEVRLKNCPQLSDVFSAFKILSCLGCKCNFSDGEARIDSGVIESEYIPDKLMRLMRSSALYLGACLGRTGRCTLSYPGGCELGPRPIDLHLLALEKMGADISEEHGVIECSCPAGLHGAGISLSFPSVGATENIMLAAVCAAGETVIYNSAREPEIVDLARFLRKCGADISGEGSSVIRIKGVKELHGCTYEIMPDRIVAATYLCAAALTGGELTVRNTRPEDNRAVTDVLIETGLDIFSFDDKTYINAARPLKSVGRIRTMPYPGFPTDAQPLVSAVLTRAKGTSIIVENIFENRYKHNPELVRMGANIKTEGKVAVIEGVPMLFGTRIMAGDLRAGAALLIAALSAEGISELGNIEYIDRGYESIEKVFSKLGANIKRTVI